MATIGLVACAKTKASDAQPAKDLYLSHIFLLAKRYCEENYERWYILSACHGLLLPETIIEPYDYTLATFSPAARENWRQIVIGQIKAKENGDPLFCFHAGGWYAKLLAGHVGDSLLPLKGLGIGQQIAWYLERL